MTKNCSFHVTFPTKEKKERKFRSINRKENFNEKQNN